MAFVQDNKTNVDQEDGTTPTKGETDPSSNSEPDLFSIHKHQDFGRYIVAKSYVPVKGLILDETPIMCAPWPIDDQVTYEEPLCLGCCEHMKLPSQVKEDEEFKDRDPLEFVNRCSRCNWPVCSSECEEVIYHAENECQLFRNCKLPYPPPGDNMNIVTTSVMIQLIRCLLIKKRHTPKFWKDTVLQLQSSTALGTVPWNYDLLLDDIKEILPELEDSLGKREECCKVLSIININAFSNTFNRNGDFSGCAICLFLNASMIAHSCRPNCWWTLTEDASHRIIIHASEEIQKGEMITVCYSNQYSVFGTLKREEMFRNVGGFVCKCRRCLDPSELASYASAVLCENCMTGYKLPEDPLEPESDWKCDLCEHVESYEISVTIVKALENRLFSIIEEQKKPVAILARFLENCKSLVHNNHWIVTQTEDAIMKEWAKDPDIRFGGTSPQEIEMTCEYYISLCYHVLSVRNIVAPGLSFHRARYLLFFARTRMARLEFVVSMLEGASRHLPTDALSRTHPNPIDLSNCTDEEREQEQKRRGSHQQFQSLRQEYQEILELYHEVIEYRQMSAATDDEIKGEIEHLMKLLTPIVQMEPLRPLPIIQFVTADDNDNITSDPIGNENGEEFSSDLTGCVVS